MTERVVCRFSVQLDQDDDFFNKGFTTADLKSEGTVSDVKDLFRMLPVGRRTSKFLWRSLVGTGSSREASGTVSSIILTVVHKLAHRRENVSAFSFFI